MRYSPEGLASIVKLHRAVLNETMARDAVFMADLNEEEIRKIMPFAHWGREFMAQEEFDIWVLLNQDKILDNEAIERITDIMEKYYGKPYPLK